MAETSSGFCRTLSLVAALLAVSVNAEDAGPQVHKLAIKSFMDFGHLVNGSNPYYSSAGEKNSEISMLPLSRANVMAIQEVSLNRFDVSVGISGLIWWPYGGGITDADQRIMNFKPMIPMARARWQFGDPASVAGAFQIGTFPYKYNPDGKNLGEYLYRAGTYPGFLWSNDGWLLMNRASNYSHGLLLSLTQLNGKLKHNFSLFMETQFNPIGDFSPGYDFSLNTKWFELGGGAVFNHYLAIHPSLLTPKNDPRNTFGHFHVEVYDSLGNPDTVDYVGSLDASLVPGSVLVDTLDIQHWTFKGIKVMCRAALNLGHLIPEAMRGPEDLRLFAELAVLGWKDYPLYYAKRNERMPIMAGITLPTAKLLDVLTLQMEYYKSPFNDIEIYNTSSLPIWRYPVDQGGVVLRDAAGNPKELHRDDIKWSVYAKKSINRVISVYAQAANDHFRLTDGKFKASSVPLTSSPTEWYYLFRLEFALR